MPARWPGHVPQLKGAWSPALSLALTEYLRKLQQGMANLQGTPGTPSQVEGNVSASAGVGPAPALDDHVHDLDTTGTPISVATTNGQGSGNGVALTNHSHRLGIVSAKGDLVVSNGTNPVALAVGADDTVLAASSGAANGVVWSTLTKDAKLLGWLALARSSRRT